MTAPEPAPAPLHASILEALPPVWPDAALREKIRARHLASGQTLVVIDDDPTGNQTVKDVPLLLSWTAEELAEELRAAPPILYILINSRALPTEQAVAINHEVAQNLKLAAQQTGARFTVVSRSDSTLRGHFPAEPDALNTDLGPYDGLLLVPYFQEGGRLTLGNIHYVRKGDTLTPAGQTPFAADPVFGYQASDLRAYAEEKSGGRWSAESVVPISLDMIRQGGPEAVAAQLAGVSGFVPVIINAADDRDLDVVVAALLDVEERLGKRFLPRTAASYVRVRGGLPEFPLISLPSGPSGGPGGLAVVGSFVPQTTAQLGHLLSLPRTTAFELNVRDLLADATSAEPGRLILDLTAACAETIATGSTAIVYTSRELVTDGDSLAIGSAIINGLCRLVAALPVRPAFIVAKGGITSNEIARAALGCTRATVLGQVAPGVPLWRLDKAARFADLPYVVFPGNVGSEQTLAEVVSRLRGEL